MPDLLSAAELAAIQDVAETGMATMASIYRRIRTQTADGWKESWPVTPNSVVPGWITEITPIGSTINVIAGALGLVEQSWLRVPIGTDIDSGDRVTANTHSYVVEHTNSASTYRPWVSCAVRSLA